MAERLDSVVTAVSIDKREASPGDVVTAIVDIEDSGSGVSSVLVIFRGPDGIAQKNVYADFNQETGQYEAKVTIGSKDLPGVWLLSQINVWDNSYNSNYLKRERIQNPENGDFTIVNAEYDVTPPSVQSVTVDKKKVGEGDVITLSVEATDTQTGIRTVSIFYRNGKYGIGGLADLNPETGKYEWTYEVRSPSSMPLGTWTLLSIDVVDKNQNRAEYYSAPYSETFKVIDKNDTSAPTMPSVNPVLNVDTKVTGKTDQFTEVTVKIGELEYKGTSDLNGDFSISIPRQVEGTEMIVTATDLSENTTPAVTIIVSDGVVHPSISYSTHVETLGWLPPSKDGELGGTTGQAKRLEGIVLNLEKAPYEGGLKYKTHVQDYGWMDFVTNGQISGTEGKAKRLEAIQMELTGEISNHYDIYYRVHSENFGWLDWAKNGEQAGTMGLSKRLEAIEVRLIPKGEPAPGNTSIPYITIQPTISYSTHIQSYGWQQFMKNGQLSGTTGESKRLEAIKIKLDDLPYSGGVQYKTHVETFGWQNWVSNEQISGTSGQAKRLEAIQIQLTGEIANYYDIYYRVHSESYGWLGWAKNGQQAGTEGKAKRLEGIEMVVVRKGEPSPGQTTNSFVK